MNAMDDQNPQDRRRSPRVLLPQDEECSLQLRTRVRLINDAFHVMRSDASFIQFTYSMTTPPIPKGLARVETEASDRIWLNLPPARVWVYRRA